jgi:hypothetical protein
MRRLELACLLSWREAFNYWPCLFSGELSDLRRVHLRRRVHHQWGALTHVRLQ